MDEEEFEDLFAESDLLVNLPQNVLTLRTRPITQALGQEGEEVTLEDTLIDNVLDFKADHNADPPSDDILSPLSLPDPLATPSILRSSNSSTGKDDENAFLSDYLRTLPCPVPLINVGVIPKIEAIMQSLADGILEDQGSLAIPLKTRASRPKPGTTFHAGTGVANYFHQPKDVCFPGSTPRGAWRFSTTPLL